MRIVVSKLISPNNINLALVEGTKVTSADVLQLRDMSIQYDNNLLPIFTEDRQCTVQSDGKLQIVNDTLSANITSEYNFIKDEALFIPLWNEYKLQALFSNNTGQVKSIGYVVAADNKIYQYISPKSQSIVAVNTIKVMYKTGITWTTIDSDHYIIDNGKKTIIFTDFAHGFYIDKEIRIIYHIINYSILIYDELGNQLQPEYFRIEPEKYVTAPNDPDDIFKTSETAVLNDIYTVRILFANVLKDDITYFVEYSAYNPDTNTTATKIEVINLLPLYKKVLDFEPYHNRSSYVYRIDDNTFDIYTKLHEQWPIVFVKYPRNRNSKIAPLEPQNRPHDVPWFLEITNDKFIRTTDEGNYTYRPLERLQQNVVNDSYTIKISKEDIKKIDEYTIKTQFDNLHINYNNSGRITNIVIYNNGIDISSYIEWVDAKRGIIKLTKVVNISQLDNYIQYQYKIYNIQYQAINLNPYMIFNQVNNTIIDKFIVVYTLPLEEINQSKGRSIFHEIVYKYPERHEGVSDYQQSISSAIAYLEGNSDGIGTIKLFDLPPSGTVIYFGEPEVEYAERYNKFTEGISWFIGSGISDTVYSLSDAIETSETQLLFTEDYRDADVASGDIRVMYSNGNQHIWVEVPSGSVSGDISDIIEVTDITGSRSNLYDIIGEYINSGIVDQTSLHPVILCYASSTNITTPESIEIQDIRRRGGGIPVDTQVNELLDDQIRHYLDIASWDGYAYDLSNIAVIRIKKSVKARLESVLAKFDPVAQRGSKYDSSFDITTYTESYIDYVIKKYLNAACEYSIEYVED